ncbi:hypothetical protein JOQ06_028784 [Pogonophryne albipinna]|uniref:Tyrosine specific protein phosphatases domain-containing protein n=1 Tax=Pogonophryne albipinna TaxID=1090488 RepID=A0AAD6B758_9TELE|nr:hypothetical protein JOQ06_028784 [Pogonophryne albipinna]
MASAPHNFSWVDQDKVAGLGLPRMPGEYRYLLENNIKHLIDRFLSIVEEANAKGEGVAVHCMHGHGRTGTMLACYLVKTRKMSGIDAINEIRRLRSGSIETNEQEKAVVRFYQRTK